MHVCQNDCPPVRKQRTKTLGSRCRSPDCTSARELCPKRGLSRTVPTLGTTPPSPHPGKNSAGRCMWAREQTSMLPLSRPGKLHEINALTQMVRCKLRLDGRAQGFLSAGKPPTPDAIWSPHRLSGFRTRAPLRRSGNRPVRTVGWKGDLWYTGAATLIMV